MFDFSFMIEGISENNLGERTQVDGQALLDRIFPFQIQNIQYSKEKLNLIFFDMVG